PDKALLAQLKELSRKQSAPTADETAMDLETLQQPATEISFEDIPALDDMVDADALPTLEAFEAEALDLSTLPEDMELDIPTLEETSEQDTAEPATVADLSEAVQDEETSVEADLPELEAVELSDEFAAL